MNLQKIEALLDAIEAAEITQVEDSPYLHSCDRGPIMETPENEVLRFSWHDDEGLEYEHRFTEQALSDAVIDGHIISCKNNNGEDVKIVLWSLTPNLINLPTGL